MAELKINGSGVLELSLAVRRQLGSEPLQLMSCSTEHLLLGRPEANNPVLLAGMLGDLAIPDLLSFFNMFRKTGILHFVLAGGERALYFQQGEIVYATSSFAEDDLGEVLVFLGKAERDQIGEVRKRADAKAALGKLLVENGAIVPRDLWLATRSQVEQIVYRMFAVQQGSFYFESKSLDQEQQLRLSMKTQNLIMEGLRRQDEQALFMRRVVSLDHYPVPTGEIPDSLPQDQASLLKLLDEESLSASELFRKAGLSEFDGIRSLHALLEADLLQMEDAPSEQIGGALGRVLKNYNNLFRFIALEMATPESSFIDEVASILFQLPQPYSFVLREVELLADGSLDGHGILTNLEGLEEGDKKQLLADSLRELASLELGVVQRTLDADRAQPILDKVSETENKVRAMIGGAE